MKSEGKDLLNSKTSSRIYKKISFACDAGMGSSAMGATTFRNRLKKAGITDIEVKHFRIEDIPADSDLAVIHKDLVERAKLSHPDLDILPITSYLKDDALEELYQQIIQS